MTASSTQGHDAAERSFGLTPAAEGLGLRLTEGGHFDATLVLVEVVEAAPEAGRPRRSRRMGRTLVPAASCPNSTAAYRARGR